MKSGAGRMLVAVVHQLAIPAALVVVCVLMSSNALSTDHAHEGAENPEHVRSCPVCQSPYRFAQLPRVWNETAEF